MLRKIIDVALLPLPGNFLSLGRIILPPCFFKATLFMFVNSQSFPLGFGF